METYAILQQMSSGYISGTIPPKFSDDHKKPIDACGSDSIIRLDGRKSVYNLQNDVRQNLIKNKRFNIVKFRIVKAVNFLRNERTIYTSELLF